MVRAGFVSLLIRILFLTIFVVNISIAQEDSASQFTYTNRLTKVTLIFESIAPVERSPHFVIPQGAKAVRDFLKSTIKDNKYYYEYDLYVFFEKDGEYNLGPFIFYDIENRSVSLPPVKINVSNIETVYSDTKKSKKTDLQIPPKFFIVKSNEIIYPYTPIYLILEINQPYEKADVLWTGWEDVFTEKISEERIDDDTTQLRFLLIFTKSGNYNLAPIKFKVEKNNKSFLFSSSPLIYTVSSLPQDINNNGYGDIKLKINAYTGTNKNEVIIRADYSGSGYLRLFNPNKPTVTNVNNVFLKDYSFEMKAFYPVSYSYLSYIYYFKPPEEGTYQIKFDRERIFDPKNSVFREISSSLFTLKVMLPGNPEDDTSQNGGVKLPVKKKIDYDFYGLIVLLLLVTFLIVGFYLRNFYESKRKKNKEENGELLEEDVDELSVVLRSFLVILGSKSNRDLLTAPFSKIEDSINNIIEDESTRKEVLNWFREVYKSRYLGKINFKKRRELTERGLELIKIVKDI